jgi:hypothetical protein
MSVAVNAVPTESPVAASEPTASRRQGVAQAVALARQHWPFTVGLATTVLGVIIVILGWSGAANTTVLQYQLPYIISGGILGVGLIVLGGMYQIGYALWLQQQKVLKTLTDSLERQGPVVAAVATDDAGQVVVVPGGTSYHVEGCRITTSKPGARRLALPTAEREGLKPCRICHG